MQRRNPIASDLILFVPPLNAPAPPKQPARQGVQRTSPLRNHSAVMRLRRREGAAGCCRYVFSVVDLKLNGARRSRRFRVAQTRIHRGYAEAQDIADGEAA